MISVVTWLWGDRFRPEHVETLRAGIAQHLSLPHEFVCITDRQMTLPGVRVVHSPAHKIGRGCFRRMAIFSRDAAMRANLRGWVWQLDLDSAIVGPLDNLARSAMTHRSGAVWAAPSVGRHGVAYNPGMIAFAYGSLDSLWQEWDKRGSLLHQDAQRAGWVGTDQAIVGHRAREVLRHWSRADGVYSYRDHAETRNDSLPRGAAIVQFYDRWPELQVCRYRWAIDAWGSKPVPGGASNHRDWAYDGPLNWGRRFRRIAKESAGLDVHVFDDATVVPAGARVWMPLVCGWQGVTDDVIGRLHVGGVQNVITYACPKWPGCPQVADQLRAIARNWR